MRCILVLDAVHSGLACLGLPFSRAFPGSGCYRGDTGVYPLSTPISAILKVTVLNDVEYYNEGQS